MFDAFFCRATREERAAILPGDEDIPDPVAILDHGLDIAAPPEAVWPWLTPLLAAPVHFIMQQRQLSNIRHRAESRQNVAKRDSD